MKRCSTLPHIGWHRRPTTFWGLKNILLPLPHSRFPPGPAGHHTIQARGATRPSACRAWRGRSPSRIWTAVRLWCFP